MPLDLLIDQSTLALLADRAKRIIPGKTTAPILACCVLSATPLGLTVTASDREIAYVGQHTATVRDVGGIAVKADDLHRAAKALPAGPVSITVNDRMKVTLKNGRSKFEINGLDAADYPPLPEITGAKVLEIDAADLRRIIDQAMVAVAATGNKHRLDGFHAHIAGDAFRLVTMDGDRLAWAEAPYTGELGGAKGMILPFRAVDEIRKILDGVAGAVSLSMSDRAGNVTATNIVMHFRLMESDFPPYEQFLPKGHKRRTVVARKEWIDALKRLANFSPDSKAARFVFSEETIAMSTSKSDVGSSAIDVDAKLIGEPVTIGFNAVFMAEALAQIAGEHVVMELVDPLMPGILRDPNDPTVYFLVMPMRLDQAGV